MPYRDAIVILQKFAIEHKTMCSCYHSQYRVRSHGLKIGRWGNFFYLIQLPYRNKFGREFQPIYHLYKYKTKTNIGGHIAYHIIHQFLLSEKEGGGEDNHHSFRRNQEARYNKSILWRILFYFWAKKARVEINQGRFKRFKIQD